VERSGYPRPAVPPTSRILVFAYGSNMHAERMRARVPSAVSRGRAWVAGRRLVFNKRGRDGSAKANLSVDPEGGVWGVVWEVEATALAGLDPYEGGYERIRASAETDDGTRLEVEVYVSEQLTDDATPFDWYMDHVLHGARAHGLPAEYLAWLEAWPRRRGDREPG
jgi:gamma-glutamylcyclotransferase